jgi:splicing factor 3A subunit 1
VCSDIIKLTAQYTAANGVQFLYGLTNREFKNPQFDFLKPSHALFTYFMALVDQYSKVSVMPRGR